MHAMQYEITLPADYDMGVIRKRVATRGHLLDDFPALGLKAYLIRERGVNGSPVNQYAPFYLWAGHEGMNAFLWGTGFQGLVDDFGRPQVLHWAGAAYGEGPAAGSAPRAAVRHRARIPAGTRPAAAVEQAVAAHERLVLRDGLVAAAVAADPHHWDLLTFSLWAHTPRDEPGDTYEVLHVSAPERPHLPRGRHW
ncbi:DUF4865 family protein [Streptomyces sp. MUM 203J]|uniref:DUF4865 family protein n=1 Tax=Streptomyces sp. MUM 203J TaxID=2791990 RepID=UPI001F03A0E9|nr:DUF4865 family protein [Streptomyces sp. MUM 203J]MCH0542769.1 DUF4865 family protein [Streptomyces sp. MUM 203J]